MKRRPTSHCCVTKDLLVKLICGLLAVGLTDENDTLDGNRNDAPVRPKPKGYCLSLFLTDTIKDQITRSRLHTRITILQPVELIAALYERAKLIRLRRNSNAQRCT